MDKNDERSSVLNSQIKAYECPDDYAFVSYSDDDAEIVSPNLTLLNDLGLNVFHNGGLEKPIVSLPHIEEKIKNSSVFIPFLTPNVTVSSSSGKEIMLAGLHKDKIAILPIFLKEMDLDPRISSLIGKRSSILRYQLTAKEYKEQCHSELDRIGLKVKRRPFGLKLIKDRLFNKEVLPSAGMTRQVTMDMKQTDEVKPSEQERPEFVYLSFSHEDIVLIYEDMMYFVNQNAYLRYDKEIDFNNQDAFDSKWLKDVEYLIRNSSQFIFYASAKSLKSSKRIYELQYAIKEEKPIYLVQIEELNQSYPSFEKIIAENPGIIRCNFYEKEYIKREYSL